MKRPVEYHIIKRKDEVLVARLVPEDDTTEDRIELGYGRVNGIIGTSEISKGGQRYQYSITPEGIMIVGLHAGYADGIHRLGPILRDQLPNEWKEVLGEWFAREESEEKDDRRQFRRRFCRA